MLQELLDFKIDPKGEWMLVYIHWVTDQINAHVDLTSDRLLFVTAIVIFPLKICPCCVCISFCFKCLFV